MKHCSKCNTDRDESEFRNNKSRYDGLQAYCISCEKEFQKEWYLNNKEKVIAKTKIRNLENNRKIQSYIIQYLLNNPCVKCGESDIVVLEFDHLRDKEFNISQGSSLEKIKKEIEKCQVLCANCHKRKTAKDFNWYKSTVSLEG